MDIKLTFINQSNHGGNSDIVIFQKNTPHDANDTAIAWTVIQNCAKGDSHPFVYSQLSTIGYSDGWGNFTPQLAAQPGTQFSAIRTPSGDQIVLSGSANEPTEIDLLNTLPEGVIDALLYNDSRPIASKPTVPPQQVAVFQPQPTLWIGPVSGVEQGEVMDAAIVATIETQISLLGIASADIVMTGGGAGPNAEPLLFTLQNVVMA